MTTTATVDLRNDGYDLPVGTTTSAAIDLRKDSCAPPLLSV